MGCAATSVIERKLTKSSPTGPAEQEEGGSLQRDEMSVTHTQTRIKSSIVPVLANSPQTSHQTRSHHQKGVHSVGPSQSLDPASLSPTACPLGCKQRRDLMTLRKAGKAQSRKAGKKKR